jgi:nucleoside-diphosphate-sugar epimerase
MAKKILLIGITGDLGGKIGQALIDQGASVRAVVRKQTPSDTIEALRENGVEIIVANLQNKSEMLAACTGIDCVVSALSGLADVIIDTQKVLLDAAVEAGVPRFIPSDYSIDFTNLVPGTNRNLDLRREFHRYLDSKPIAATSIFNGAFMDLTTGDMPLILNKFKRVLYWGDPTIKMDFTTREDTARYTALAAMDDHSPRYLHIAGESINARQVVTLMTEISGKAYNLFKAGSIGRLNTFIKMAKFFSKNSRELYPAWQGMQYMRNMMEGRAVQNSHDNDRYPGFVWTGLKRYLVSKNVT